jgi:F420H(2)-dependent quinone reductase
MGLAQRAFDEFTKVHVHLYRASRGRIGGRVRRAKVLLLDNVGRKSGKKRTAPLLYVDDGDDLVIVASKGGSHKHPAWFLNLQANPETTVQVRGERRRVRAREASDAERERIWPKLIAVWSDYDNYQRRTDRQIPLVVLEPAR